MIKRIRDFLSPKAPLPGGLAYNLSMEDLAALNELTSLKEWRTFEKLLDSAATLHAERLLGTSDAADVHYLRGFILGLRKTGTIVAEIRLQQEIEDARRDRVGQRTDTRGADAELVGFSSRFWGA